MVIGKPAWIQYIQSNTLFSLNNNIAITKKVVEVAKVLGVSVEAELGRIGGQEDDLIVDEADAMYAIPEECVRTRENIWDW